MPLQIPEHELQAIVEVVASSGSGASVGDLMADDRLNLKRRTLQRRLDLLSGQGRLVTQGEGRGRRYLVPRLAIGPADDARPSTTEVDWLSAEAHEIRTVITRPLSKRRPVGYDTSFLGSYQPNATYYLPAETRRRLAAIGQVGITDLPAGTYLRQILDRLLIDLAWNSSRLEGNTYSLLETRRLLELGESAEGKATQDAQMILNHKAAIEMLADQAEEIGFNRYTLCNLHALLSDNLLSDPAACGRLRAAARPCRT